MLLDADYCKTRENIKGTSESCEKSWECKSKCCSVTNHVCSSNSSRCENNKSCKNDPGDPSLGEQIISAIVGCCCCALCACIPVLIVKLFTDAALGMVCFAFFPVVLIFATVGTGGLASPITIPLFIVWLISMCCGWFCLLKTHRCC